MKPMLDLSVGLDRAQLPHLLIQNYRPSAEPIDDSHGMHYYGMN